MAKQALCIRDIEDINKATNNPEFKIDTMFVDRDICEKPENGYLQIIPYVTFFNFDLEKGYIKFVQYKRASTITEERLSAKTSIGFGGHIDSEDDLAADDVAIEDLVADDVVIENGTTIYKLTINQILKTSVNAAKREIAEELGNDILIKLNLGDALQNFIFFRSTSDSEVNKVHLGLSIPIELTNEQFDLLLKEAIIDPNEIESINYLGVNLNLVLEEFDISNVLKNIASQLSSYHNLEDWSCEVFYIISYDILSNLIKDITYEQLLSVIKNKKANETSSSIQ